MPGRTGTDLPYGTGYVSLVRNLVLARYPDLGLRFVNRGVNGDTTRNLLARWQRDVLAERPDWLAVKIGINDAWRSFGGNARDAVPLPEYTANLRNLLDQARAGTPARLILLTPYMIEPDHQQPMRAAMDRYGAAVKGLAAEYGATLIDTQAAFDVALQHTAPAIGAGRSDPSQRAGYGALRWCFCAASGSRCERRQPC